MMRSLFAGVSGMRNHMTRQDVIGNNIANVNTPGFKASRVQFQDVLSQTLQSSSAGGAGRGSTNPMQVGLGVGVAGIDTVFTDGSFQPTGKATDLSIQGNGFFVLSDDLAALNKVYTRAGNFDFDEQGNFIVPGTGYMVQGWTADIDGNLVTSGNTGPIKIPVGAGMKPKASENMTFGNNLMATTELGEPVTESLKVYDSLGNAHQIEATFTRVGDNRWLYSMKVPDATTGTLTNQLGEITFKDNGLVDTISTATPAMPAVPTPTATIAATGFQLSSTPGSVFNNPLTVFDANGNRREFNMNFTADAAGTSWTYTITESGSATPLKYGTVAWNAGTSAYDFTTDPASPDTSAGLNFKVSNGPSISSTVAVTLGGQVGPAPATTLFTVTAPTVPATANTLTLNNTANSVYKKPITVFDAAGQARVFNMEFTANATGNGWEYKIAESGVKNPTTIKSGTISLNGTGYIFKDSAGTIDPTGLNFSFTGGPTTIVSLSTTPTATGAFSQAPTYTTAPQAAMTFNPGAGATPMTLTLDMATLTQWGNATTVKILDQDGYAAGNLESKVIDSNGIITGRYSNNQSRVLGQVAIGTFNNPGGLMKAGSSLFTQSASSGEAQIGTTGTGGRGGINPGSLEMSNVDLAQEFSNMIITQRGFQANSKIITTSDEMLQELANLKR